MVQAFFPLLLRGAQGSEALSETTYAFVRHCKTHRHKKTHQGAGQIHIH